jgi:hypothetical protein
MTREPTRLKSMRYVLAAAVFIAAMAFDLGPVRAYGTAPWCAVVDVGWGDVVWDCQYYTFEACVPNVLAGNRGFCNHNPAGPGWQRTGTDRPKHYRKRHINRD